MRFRGWYTISIFAFAIGVCLYTSQALPQFGCVSLFTNKSSISSEMYDVYFPSAQPANTNLRLPLIVFSHGTGFSKSHYSYLMKSWADLGFIVINLNHKSSNTRAFREMSEPQAIKKIQELIKDPNTIYERIQEIDQAVDSVNSVLREQGVGFQADTNNLVIAGHSIGAAVASVKAGATVSQASLRDSRVRAYIAISSPGSGVAGLNAKSWEGISTPGITISGIKDSTEVIDGKPASWRLEPFTLARPNGTHTHALINGATHNSYTSAGGNPAVQSITQSLTSAFLGQHFTLLQAAPVVRSNGSVQIFEK